MGHRRSIRCRDRRVAGPTQGGTPNPQHQHPSRPLRRDRRNMGRPRRVRLHQSCHCGSPRRCPVWSQLTVSRDPDPSMAVERAHRIWPDTGLNGQLAQDLRTVLHFERAVKLVSPEQIRDQVPCGPDPEPILERLAGWRSSASTTSTDTRSAVLWMGSSTSRPGNCARPSRVESGQPSTTTLALIHGCGMQ